VFIKEYRPKVQTLRILFGAVKLRKIRKVGNVARMVKVRFLVQKHEGTRLLGKSICRI